MAAPPPPPFACCCQPSKDLPPICLLLPALQGPFLFEKNLNSTPLVSCFLFLVFIRRKSESTQNFTASFLVFVSCVHSSIENYSINSTPLVSCCSSVENQRGVEKHSKFHSCSLFENQRGVGNSSINSTSSEEPKNARRVQTSRVWLWF